MSNRSAFSVAKTNQSNSILRRFSLESHGFSDSNGTTTSKHVLLKNCSTETSINQSPLRLSDEKQTFGRSRVPRIGFIIHGRNKFAKRGREAFVDPWALNKTLHFNPKVEVCDWPANVGCTLE